MTGLSFEQPEKILIVDDDEEFGCMLGEFLTRQGFTPSCAGSGREALQLLEISTPDLIVLDIMMPEIDGLEALRTIRSEWEIPIIMVTARGQAHDRILGLELGADDYLPKPFDPSELAARIRAVLRRFRQAFRARKPISIGPLSLRPGTMTATIGQKEVRLTPAEFMVLELLARRPGIVQSRETLTARALGRPLAPFERSIDTHVSNIRRKLGLSPDAGVEIRSVRSSGYSLTMADDK